MSNFRKKQRKLEILKIRTEGFNARKAGKHIQTCPYTDMNFMHWVEGYKEAEREDNETSYKF